ncbi:MAG: hypothetical protein FJ167_10810 [Gammaproteobacteria bacterium]|nr:hypothetical protein [Gammaproteobacteria bacterium]
MRVVRRALAVSVRERVGERVPYASRCRCVCVTVSVRVALRRCVPFAVRHAVGAYRCRYRCVSVRVVRRALAVSVRRACVAVCFAVCVGVPLPCRCVSVRSPYR